MKSLLKSTYSKTKLLIVLFAFSCGSLMMAQAEDTDSLFTGLVRSGPPDHGMGLAGGYLLVCIRQLIKLAMATSHLTPTAPI
jgi:hypothetical protein